MTPEGLVAFLNRIFSTFDALSDARGLEKIKTIGDAYMVAGGIPTPDPEHLNSIVKMAFDVRTAMKSNSYLEDRKLECRIGIHTGPVVAGIIGKRKFVYDLWGDTVNNRVVF